MKKVFNPGYIVFEIDYDQGSSGGMIIVTPGNPDYSYYDPDTGYTYFNTGEGWYYYKDGTAEEYYYGTELDVEGMEVLEL